MSLVGGLTLTGAMNKILITVIQKIMESVGISMLQILKINPAILFIDIAITLAIAVLSAIIPLLMLKKIKPIQIIKNNK